MSWAEDMGYDIYDPDWEEEEITLNHLGVVYRTGKATLFKVSDTEGVWIPDSRIIEETSAEVIYLEMDLTKVKLRNQR